MKQAVRALLGTMVACAAIGVASKGHSATVLASIPINSEHTVKLVEYLPGVTGTVEHLSYFDTPAVTPEVRGLGMVELYRHFAGATAIVPDSIVAANARANAMHNTNVPKFVPPPTVPLPNSRTGITEGDEGDLGASYESEAQEFLSGYCAYSDIYIVGYDYTELYEVDYTVSNWEVDYFLGSDMGQSTYIGAWYWNGQGWVNFWEASFGPGIGIVTWRGGDYGYFGWNIGPAGPVDVGIAASFF